MHRELTGASKNKLQDILTVCQLWGERKNQFRMWLSNVRKWQLTTCRMSYDPPEILWRHYKGAMRKQQTCCACFPGEPCRKRETGLWR
ncbi:hypothetical protein PoB_007552300 [Plakobranchus ocellatus]|uniref:Uncharacterized protein n=1 Tax=Plakobranchus ocellatus TaxID=259542 RepID=A0AAV4DXB6_9GAST|nr:hypothetical protein PoB_007552300 [Plakobranchus ocellatus]